MGWTSLDASYLAIPAKDEVHHAGEMRIPCDVPGCEKRARWWSPTDAGRFCLPHYKSCYLAPSLVLQAVVLLGEECEFCARGWEASPFALSRVDGGEGALKMIRGLQLGAAEEALQHTVLTCKPCMSREMPYVRFSENWPFPGYWSEGEIDKLFRGKVDLLNERGTNPYAGRRSGLPESTRGS